MPIEVKVYDTVYRYQLDNFTGWDWPTTPPKKEEEKEEEFGSILKVPSQVYLRRMDGTYGQKGAIADIFPDADKSASGKYLIDGDPVESVSCSSGSVKTLLGPFTTIDGNTGLSYDYYTVSCTAPPPRVPSVSASVSASVSVSFGSAPPAPRPPRRNTPQPQSSCDMVAALKRLDAAIAACRQRNPRAILCMAGTTIGHCYGIPTLPTSNNRLGYADYRQIHYG
jgi:hypothetical protein